MLGMFGPLFDKVSKEFHVMVQVKDTKIKHSVIHSFIHLYHEKVMKYITNGNDTLSTK